MTKPKWTIPTEGLREIVQNPYLVATPSRTQGEIKPDYSDWARSHALERDHPKIAKAIHYIPVANTVFASMKSGGTRPDKIAVGQALVSDAIQLAGVGKAAQSIGIAPAIITDITGNIGAYGGNELGEHVVKNNYVSADVAPYVIPASTILGGIVGGGLGYKGTKLYSNYKYGDPTKVKLIRNLGVVPEIDGAGNVVLAPEENLFANFTTDVVFRRHPSYKKRPEHVIYFDATKVGNARPISTQPSDTFFINGDIQIKPKDVTFVSGDLTALKNAWQKGFKIKFNPRMFWEKLKFSFGNNTKSSGKLSKDVTFAEAKNITPIIDKSLRSIRPRLKDYQQLGRLWNTEFPVVSNYRGAVDDYNILTKLIDRPNFKHVAYHPASDVEFRLVYEQKLKELFENAGLKALDKTGVPSNFAIGAHPRYSREQMNMTKSLFRDYIHRNPVKSQEPFSTMSPDDWDNIYFKLRDNYWNNGRTDNDLHKLKILRNKHSKVVAEHEGLARTIDKNGNYVYTNKSTGEEVVKSSEPITYRKDGTDIRLSLRDNVSDSGFKFNPLYTMFPALGTSYIWNKMIKGYTPTLTEHEYK